MQSDRQGEAVGDPSGEAGGADVQSRVVRYLERISPEEVREAARRYDEYPEERALALGRIEQARVEAEQANDGEAVDALIALRDREREA